MLDSTYRNTFDKGPLFIVEGSHKYQDIKDNFKGFDVDRDKEKKLLSMQIL